MNSEHTPNAVKATKNSRRTLNDVSVTINSLLFSSNLGYFFLVLLHEFYDAGSSWVVYTAQRIQEIVY